MKKIISLLLLFLLILTSVQAVTDAEEVPGILASSNEEIPPGLEPLVDVLRPILQKLSVIVGGIFGLYIILILLRVYYERKTLKLLQLIRYDLDHLNMHFKIPTSRERNSIWKRAWKLLKRLVTGRKK